MENEENPNDSGGSGQRTRQISESTDDPNKRRRTVSINMIPGVTDASPPKFVSLEEIMKAAKDMSNMALCHEIAVDKDFKIQKVVPPQNSIEGQVKEMMHKIFWDNLEQQLNEDPPVFDHALKLLTEIKEELMSLLLNQHSKIRQEIDEILDLELIKQKVENGVLDFKYYAQYISSVMAKMCAPARDEKINQLTQCTDVIQTFKGIFETLELMKLDMANFTLTVLRPEIVKNSEEYEKDKFKEFLKFNPGGLDLTKVWLLKFVNPDLPDEPIPAIIVRAYISIFDFSEEDLFPETLAMDEKRFLELKNEYYRLVYTSTLSLITYSNVRILSTNIKFKQDLMQNVNILLADKHGLKNFHETLPHAIEQILKETKEGLENISAPPMEEDNVLLLKALLEDTALPNNKIRLVVEKRIKEFLQETISSATAAPVRVPPGLSMLQKPLTSLAGQYLRLVTHNRKVFGEFYHDILSTRTSTPPTTTE